MQSWALPALNDSPLHSEWSVYIERIISSCEETFFPFSTHRVIFAKVNVLANMLIGMFTQLWNTLKLKMYFSDDNKEMM